MLVKFTVGVGYSGCNREEELELPDHFTEEDIEKELNEWMFEYIDSGYEILEEDDDDEDTGT